MYPDFDSLQHLRFARFSVLRDIYEKEKNLLVKTAPKLNFKSMYPSTLERQKVSLALNVWHESTVAAVRKHMNDEMDHTAVFLEIIRKWWSIMNIQSQFEYIGKRYDMQKPFESSEDERFIFLKTFVEWLRRWKPVPKNGGFFTIETYTALLRQTVVMIQFLEYALIELKIPYVLPGKIQSDMLEKRFGRYRSLSGNNYNISALQVCRKI